MRREYSRSKDFLGPPNLPMFEKQVRSQRPASLGRWNTGGKSSRRDIKPFPRSRGICAFYVLEIEPNQAPCLLFHAAQNRTRAHARSGGQFGSESAPCFSSKLFCSSQQGGGPIPGSTFLTELMEDLYAHEPPLPEPTAVGGTPGHLFRPHLPSRAFLA